MRPALPMAMALERRGDFVSAPARRRRRQGSKSDIIKRCFHTLIRYFAAAARSPRGHIPPYKKVLSRPPASPPCWGLSCLFGPTVTLPVAALSPSYV